MARIILINKPYNMLSQFTDRENRPTLAQIFSDNEIHRGFYPAGRLDFDSEGLLLLTNDGAMQQRITAPKMKMPKVYWVQVEGEPIDNALIQLRKGVQLKDGLTAPASVKRLTEPSLWPRSIPVRQRREIPTQWLEITITEGRNRQIRRMTAAIGHPTLRLVRLSIGPWALDKLMPGQYRYAQVHLPAVRRMR